MRICIGIAQVLCLSQVAAQQAESGLKLVHADFLRRETKSGQTIQKLEGNVRFQQGETTILCDVATQRLQRKQYALIGHVEVITPGETLVADTIYIHEPERKQIASGNVLRVTENDSTSADRMTFWEIDNRLLSEGRVRVANVRDGAVLTGGVAEYWRKRDIARVWDTPVWIMRDSLGAESTKISADTLVITEGGDRTTASGNVKIVQKGTVATCDLAEHDKRQNQILLTQNPKVVQHNQTISGDSLQLFLENGGLTRADVRGNALAVSDADTLSPGRWHNQFSGQYMSFSFVAEEINRMAIRKQATSTYHIIEEDGYKGENQISGDEIVIEFDAGEVKRVVVKSDPDVAEGKFSPPKL